MVFLSSICQVKIHSERQPVLGGKLASRKMLCGHINSMITVIRLIDVNNRKLTFRDWRFTRSEVYTHWLYFGELTDNVDGPSYTEEWLAENAFPLRGEWLNYQESRRAAQRTVAQLEKLGHSAVTDDIVND